MKKLLPFTLLLASCQSAMIPPPTIEHSQVVSDITYLASDELKGRATFSPGITQAAEFISKRFKEAGLVPLEGLSGYQQHFSLFNIKSNDFSLSINGQVIDAKSIAVATAYESLNWQTLNGVDLVVINKDDNFRNMITEINSVGKNTLVIADPSHQKMFSRYQQYFAGGLNKFALNTGASLVMVLGEMQDIKSIELQAKASVTEQKLANVVGVLPGKSKEVVLFSAHYDHLGMDESKSGDKIYNGADDDASGTTAVINLASYYAQQGDNQRTLMFSAFTAEEIGGYGSRYFSNQLDADNISAMINIEMIGKPSKFGAGTFWMTGYERSDLGQIMNTAMQSIDQKVHADPYPKQRLFYRSDNATLARLGVPAHSFSSTQLDKDKHYHQLSDDIASLDLPSMTAVIKSIAIGSQSLVDGTATPTRVDTSKVKSAGKIY